MPDVSTIVKYAMSVGNKSGAIPAAPQGLLKLKESIEGVPFGLLTQSMQSILGGDVLGQGLQQLAGQLGGLENISSQFQSILGQVTSGLASVDQIIQAAGGVSSMAAGLNTFLGQDDFNTIAAISPGTANLFTSLVTSSCSAPTNVSGAVNGLYIPGPAGTQGPQGPAGNTGPSGPPGAGANLTFINSASYSGTANNALYLGGVVATQYAFANQIGGGGMGNGVPGGANGTIQFNDSGAFGGNGELTFSKTTGTLTVNGATINSTMFSGGANTALTANNSTNLGGAAASAYLLISGLAANVLPLGYQTQAGLSANVATLNANTANTANNSLNLGGFFANQYAFANATPNLSYINSTSYSGTSNNSLFLGGVVATSYVNSAQLASNISALAVNNTTFFAGNSTINVVANSSGFYQNGAAFSSGGGNAALANNSLYLGGFAANQYAYANATPNLSYINSTSYSGTSNNSLFLGGFAANQYAYANSSGAAVNTCFFSVNNPSTQGGIVTSTFTNVVFSNVVSDAYSCWVSANNAFKPNVSGNYQFHAGVYFSGNSAGVSLIQITKNGTEAFRGTQTPSGAGVEGTVSSIVPMNGTTDYVQIQVYTSPTSGTGTIGAGDPGLIYFNGQLIPGSTAGPTGPAGAAVNNCLVIAQSNVNTQSASNSAFVIVQFPSIVTDAYSCFSNSTTFTPKVAGNYLVRSHVPFTPTTASTTVILDIWKNGVEYARPFQHNITSSAFEMASIEAIVPMNGTTDFLNIQTLLQNGNACFMGSAGAPALMQFEAVLLPGTTAGPPGSGSVPATTTVANTSVGYVVSNTGSFVATSSTSIGTACTITLFPGIWDLECDFIFSGANSTTTTDLYMGLYTASGTVSSAYTTGSSLHNRYNGGSGTTDVYGQNGITRKRVTIATTTTIYANCRWDGSTPASYTVSVYPRATLC